MAGPEAGWVAAEQLGERLHADPAWNFDEHTGQYYLCSFTTKQADLNWRNPEVQEAMFDDLSFWLDRGVDGIRIDVAHFVMKDPELRDNPLVEGRSRVNTKDHGEYDLYDHLYDKGHPDNHALSSRRASAARQLPARAVFSW